MKITGKILLYLFLTIAALTFLYPFLWMLIASFSPAKDMGNLTLFPSAITFENYSAVIDKIPIGRAFINSLFVSGAVTAGVLVFGSLVGYALSRMDFKGRDTIFYIIVFTMTLPFQITLIPQYIIMVKLQWVDTYWALIIPYLLNAFSIIMFRQYFKSLPQDLIDAARIDGCNELQIIFRILWPS